MSKRAKVILGIATLWPIAYTLFLIVGLFIYRIVQNVTGGEKAAATSPGMPYLGVLLLTLHFLTMVWMLFLLAIYIDNVYHNKKIPAGVKTLWGVALFFGNIAVMPVYWYLYIWSESVVGGGPTSEQVQER